MAPISNNFSGSYCSLSVAVKVTLMVGGQLHGVRTFDWWSIYQLDKVRTQCHLTFLKEKEAPKVEANGGAV